MLYSIDKKTGDLNWKTIVDDHPHAMQAMSPVVDRGMVFTGLSSQISGTLGLGAFGIGIYDPDVIGLPDPWFGSCCDYQGAVIALDEKTGEVVWKTYTLPEQDVPSYQDVDAAGVPNVWVGASVWGGGNPAVDDRRKSIYVGTGEAFMSTIAANTCESARLAMSFPGDPFDDGCLDFNQDGSPIDGPLTAVPTSEPGVAHASHPLVDAVISLDQETGDINWARRLGGFDLWNFSCFAADGSFPGPFPVNPVCPPYLRSFPNAFLQFPVASGGFGVKDLDVGEQPILVKNVKMPGGGKKDIVMVTSKGSNVFAFDAEDGSDVWNIPRVSFGPGSLFGGGIIWGSASDGKRLYSVSTTSSITLANLNDPDMAVVTDTCPTSLFVGGVWPGGVYTAVDVATGRIAWQTCVTGTQIDVATRLPLLDGGEPVIRAGNAESPVSVANGVVFVGGARRLSALDPAGDPDNPVDFLTEVVALDAKTGEVLRRLPMSVPGHPAAFNIRYQRAVAVGDTLYITNGFKEPTGGVYGVADICLFPSSSRSSGVSSCSLPRSSREIA